MRHPDLPSDPNVAFVWATIWAIRTDGTGMQPTQTEAASTVPPEPGPKAACAADVTTTQIVRMRIGFDHDGCQRRRAHKRPAGIPPRIA